MDNIKSNKGYCDYIKDPLDSKKNNVEFIDSCKDGYVILKSTKNIKACSEILYSFGKKSWISEFRRDWCPSNNSNLNNYSTIVKNAIFSYDIDEEEAINASKKTYD